MVPRTRGPKGAIGVAVGFARATSRTPSERMRGFRTRWPPRPGSHLLPVHHVSRTTRSFAFGRRLELLDAVTRTLCGLYHFRRRGRRCRAELWKRRGPGARDSPIILCHARSRGERWRSCLRVGTRRSRDRRVRSPHMAEGVVGCIAGASAKGLFRAPRSIPERFELPDRLETSRPKSRPEDVLPRDHPGQERAGFNGRRFEMGAEHSTVSSATSRMFTVQLTMSMCSVHQKPCECAALVCGRFSATMSRARPASTHRSWRRRGFPPAALVDSRRYSRRLRCHHG